MILTELLCWDGFASTTTLGPLESLMFNSPIGCRVGSSMVVMPAGELYAFIMAQWRKFKGREDERHIIFGSMSSIFSN